MGLNLVLIVILDVWLADQGLLVSRPGLGVGERVDLCSSLKFDI